MKSSLRECAYVLFVIFGYKDMTPTGVSAEIEIIAMKRQSILSINPMNPNPDKWWTVVPAALLLQKVGGVRFPPMAERYMK